MQIADFDAYHIRKDLEIFALQNFRMTNFHVEKFRRNDPVPH